MKRVFVIYLAAVMLFLTSCSGIKITPEIQQSIDVYTNAVDKTITKNSGSVKVTSVNTDNAIDFNTTSSLIEFEYVIEDSKVLFNRNDYINDKLTAIYICNGDTISVKNDAEGDFKDVTEQNKAFLNANKNPFITLSLFRVDSNGKINNTTLQDVLTYSQDGFTVVEFVLSDKAVSTVLGFSKADGVVRESNGHSRKYYINNNGVIEKIIIEANQKIISNGQTGDYKTSITVEIS